MNYMRIAAHIALNERVIETVKKPMAYIYLRFTPILQFKGIRYSN